MGSDTAASSFSIIAPQKGSSCDEILMQHRLHFADSLKDLKNLRQQLYSAAEYFESSYDKDDHKQFVIDSSKDYASKALVSTIDHLGSIADKLNKFLDGKTDEFSSTNTRICVLQERLNTFQGFVDLRGVSRHSLTQETRIHHKQYHLPGSGHASHSRKQPNLVYKDCVPCPQNDTSQLKHDNPFVKGFQVAVIKPLQPNIRKAEFKSFSSEIPRSPINFSFTRVLSTKEGGTSGKRWDSPPRLMMMRRSGSVAYRSISPGSSAHVRQSSSESRRSNMMMSCIKPETTNRERQIISYTKKSKHILKALLSIHHSRKDSTKSCR